MRAETLVQLVNRYWSTIPSENLPTYDSFNVVIPVNENKDKLLELENNNPIIGVARVDSEDCGLTALSLIATITDAMGGFRLAAVVNDERKIVGWSAQQSAKGDINNMDSRQVAENLRNLKNDKS